jgi:hypothetical protein
MEDKQQFFDAVTEHIKKADNVDESKNTGLYIRVAVSTIEQAYELYKETGNLDDVDPNRLKRICLNYTPAQLKSYVTGKEK